MIQSTAELIMGIQKDTISIWINPVVDTGKYINIYSIVISKLAEVPTWCLGAHQKEL